MLYEVITANKIEIKEAVERIYGVNVERVNTMRYDGKEKTRYTKTKIISGRTSSYKKAIVTVADGEVIDFYSGIAIFGLGNSNVFPVMFSQALIRKPDNHNEVSGLMITGVFGGAIIPLFMGIASRNNFV